jgi:hypothetical protein
MNDVIRKNLALLTLVAALIGALGSVVFRWNLSHTERSLIHRRTGPRNRDGQQYAHNRRF